MKEIFKSRGELFDDATNSNAHEGDNKQNQKFKFNINVNNSLSPEDAKILDFNKKWPEGEPIVFNFRMPVDN